MWKTESISIDNEVEACYLINKQSPFSVVRTGNNMKRTISTFFSEQYKTIGLVSPASLPDADEVQATVSFLEAHGHRVILGDHALETGTDPYCCSSIEGRVQDLNRMIADSAVDLIYCTRGGYGSAQLLPFLDFELLAKRGLPVLGYSDISAIHLAMLSRRAGIPVVFPMAAGLRKAMEDDATAQYLASGWDVPQNWILSQVSGELRVREPLTGTLIASNLSLLASLCGTPWLPSFEGAILVLEDVGEKLRILDRHLTQLMLCGILSQVKAVVFGHLTDCQTKRGQLHLLRKFSSLTHKPFFHGLPFGHEAPRMILRNGMQFSICAPDGRKRKVSLSI